MGLDPFDIDGGDRDWDGMERGVCERCGGTGSITDCPDDLCQGENGCIHGDNETCPDCRGEGEC